MPTIAEIINGAAAKYGLDPQFLMRQAQIESSMNPRGTSPLSSAKGLFQIMKKEAAQYGIDPFDPVANTDVASRMAVDNKKFFQTHMGRDPSNAELYLMHQQGPTGTVKMLQNPNAPADTLVPRINITNNGGKPGQMAGDFVNFWTNKFDGVTPNANSAAVQPPSAAQGGMSVPEDPGTPATALGLPLLMADEPLLPKKKTVQKPVQPQRSLDLASLLQDLSPNLVLGGA